MAESKVVYSAKFKCIIEQKRWFDILCLKSSPATLARICKCSERTVRDWRRGKFLPRYDCILKLCSVYKLPFPRVTQISRKAHLSTIAKLGGKATIARYGKPKVSETIRQSNWRAWWNRTGKFDEDLPTAPHKIKIPRKSKKLAEFFGIMIGDGGISAYRADITLNATDDREYALFVTQLITELFGVTPKIYRRKGKNAVAITVSRTRLVAYLHSLGLPIGNKITHQIHIPSWIIGNEENERACLRGLFDTDGSIFTHEYRTKGKKYRYKKISFSSASERLLSDVHMLLFKNNIRAHRANRNVRIDSKESFLRYMAIIGTHNLKHLKRSTD